MQTLSSARRTCMASASAVECRSEEHTSELQSRPHLVCRLLLEKKKALRSDGFTLVKKLGPCHGETWGRYFFGRGSHPSNLPFTGCSLKISMRRTRKCSPQVRTSWNLWKKSFFYNDTATSEIYTLSLHDALPI